MMTQAALLGPKAKAKAKPKAHNTRTILKGNSQWYTPGYLIDIARSIMGGIDLDPASCDVANQTVKAARFYHDDKAGGGLVKSWHGRVWLNPPYADGIMGAFIDKAIEEHRAGRMTEALILTNASTEVAWFRAAANYAGGFCLLKRRVRFIYGGPEEDKPKDKGAAQGQAMFYFGPQWDRFSEALGPHGLICRLVNQAGGYAPARLPGVL